MADPSVEKRLPRRSMLRRGEFTARYRRLLDHHYVRVEADRFDRRLERRRTKARQSAAVRCALSLIEIIGKRMGKGREVAATPMHVLANVDATRPDMGQYLFQRDQLLFRLMTAIIDHHIDRFISLAKRSPELAVRLIADGDFRLLILVGSTLRRDIDAGDAHPRTEVVTPQIEASTAVNADLHDMRVRPHEFSEVAVINVEVVKPFPDPAALGSRI